MGVFGISLPTQWREMSAAEYHIVSPVFGPTLPPRGRILVTNAVGLNRRPFTIPVALLETVGMPLPPPLAEGAPQGVYRTGYVINVGYRYPNLILDQRLLVHEMTHVWQGHNSLLPVSYVIGSVVAQALHGGAAYNLTLGQPWKSYNPEQQATIVEQWFVSGQSTTDPRYSYIANHVRKGDC